MKPQQYVYRVVHHCLNQYNTLYELNILSLVDKLNNLFTPSTNVQQLRYLKSGTKIDNAIIQGLLNPTKTGEILLEKCMETRVRRTCDYTTLPPVV